jgi:hypothetical protein
MQVGGKGRVPLLIIAGDQRKRDVISTATGIRTGLPLKKHRACDDERFISFLNGSGNVLELWSCQSLTTNRAECRQLLLHFIRALCRKNCVLHTRAENFEEELRETPLAAARNSVYFDPDTGSCQSAI